MYLLFAYDFKERDNEFVKIHYSLLHEMGYHLEASVEEFWNPTQNYDAVIINWPEYFFRWRNQIKDEEVQKLNNAILNFKKKGIRIITFLHDEYSHFGRSANLNLIFDILYQNSDVLIHLGNYSKTKYEKIYKQAIHHIIHHPLYKVFDLNLDYKESRTKLRIKQSERLFVVPGGIRKEEEHEYCLRLFKALDISNKKMIFLNSNFLKRPENCKNLIGLKSWIYYLIRKTLNLISGKIIYKSGFLSPSLFSIYITAADWVLIPRVDTLNSGNITLAAQFGKKIISTGNGNMTELIKFLEQSIINKDIVGATYISELTNQLAKSKIIQEKIKEYADDEVIRNQWQKVLQK